MNINFRSYMTESTQIMYYEKISKTISLSAKQFDIPESLIKAIIDTESQWDIHAVRFEPDLHKRKWAKKVVVLNDLDPNDKYVWSSCGLMQVLLINAVDSGLNTNSLYDLMKPEVNIYYGSKYLGKLKRRFRNRGRFMLTDIISAYNQGGNYFYDDNGDKLFQPENGEKYKNQKYVNKVLKEYQKLLKAQGIKSKYNNLINVFLEGK